MASDVIEVSIFSSLDGVLGATDVGFITDFAGEFVDSHSLSAALVVGAGTVDLGAAVAVALQVLEVLGGDTFHQFVAEVSLEDFSEVGVLPVRHQDSEPGEVVLCLDLFKNGVYWLRPEVAYPDAEIGLSGALVLLGFLGFGSGSGFSFVVRVVRVVIIGLSILLV